MFASRTLTLYVVKLIWICVVSLVSLGVIVDWFSLIRTGTLPQTSRRRDAYGEKDRRSDASSTGLWGPCVRPEIEKRINYDEGAGSEIGLATTSEEAEAIPGFLLCVIPPPYISKDCRNPSKVLSIIWLSFYDFLSIGSHDTQRAVLYVVHSAVLILIMSFYLDLARVR